MKNKINMFESLENRTLLAGANDAGLDDVVNAFDCNLGEIAFDPNLTPEEYAAQTLTSCGANVEKGSYSIVGRVQGLEIAKASLVEKLTGVNANSVNARIWTKAVANFDSEIELRKGAAEELKSAGSMFHQLAGAILSHKSASDTAEQPVA